MSANTFTKMMEWISGFIAKIVQMFKDLYEQLTGLMA